MSNKQSHSIKLSKSIHIPPMERNIIFATTLGYVQIPWAVSFFLCGCGSDSMLSCLTMFPRGHALPRGKTGSKTKIHIDIEAALCRHPRRFTCIKMCKHEKVVHIIYIYTIYIYIYMHIQYWMFI